MHRKCRKETRARAADDFWSTVYYNSKALTKATISMDRSRGAETKTLFTKLHIEHYRRHRTAPARLHQIHGEPVNRKNEDHQMRDASHCQLVSLHDQRRKV